MAMVPFFSTNNDGLHKKLAELREMMQQLKCKAADIKKEVQNEELQSTKKRKTEVTLWFNQVCSKVAEFEVIEKEVASVGTFGHRQLLAKLEEMMDRVKQLAKQSEFPRGLLLDGVRHEGLELVPQKMEGSTPSRVEAEVWNRFETGVSRVGVFGIGGVGKTTLAMNINNHIFKQHRRLFKCVYYVTVSRETSLHKLQGDIAKAFDLRLKYEDVPERAAELRMGLANREKCLLILDDVWEDIAMEKVGVSAEGDGCNLLITTRDRSVCRKMNCFPVEMNTLSPDESWDLFKKQLGHFETLPDEIKDIATSVATECDGLPLGIVTMARSMRGVTSVHTWRNALDRLRNPVIGQHDMKEKVFSILRHSYDRLSDDKHRKCFLYCALYPEDEEIVREELISDFIRAGLLDGTNRNERIDEGHTLLDHIENASMLECVTDWEDSRCVKMHDLVRDMAIEIIGSTGMLKRGMSLKEIPGKEEWNNKDLEWVSLMHNEIVCIEGMMPDCPKISVLLLRGNRHLRSVSDSFFVQMIGLKVLDLSHTEVKELPGSISGLFNLNALLLYWCKELEYIPSLAKLTKLRELNISGCRKMRTLLEGMEKILTLEHLNLRHIGIQDLYEGIASDSFFEQMIGLEVIDLSYTQVKRLPDSVSKLLNLNTLRLSECQELEYIPSLAKLTKLRELNLRWCEKMRTMPKGMEKLSSLEHLSLEYSGIEGVYEGIVSDSLFERMIGLKVLDLSSTKVKKLPDSVSKLLNLNSLLLSFCDELDYIPSLAKLKKLRELNLRCCMKMRTMPKGMEKLSSLEHLSLEYSGIKGVYEGIFINLLNLESFSCSDGIYFPAKELISLKHLKVLDGVHFIFKDVSEFRVFKQCVGDFKSLETYDVTVQSKDFSDDFDKLDEYYTRKLVVEGAEECFLLPQNVEILKLRECNFGVGSLLEAFPYLADATNLYCCRLDNCEGIEYIFPEGWTKNPLQVIQILVLRKLHEFGGLITAEVVYPYISFPGLRELEIHSCRKLKKLWMLNLDLPNLGKICISDCEQMEQIFATEKGGTVRLPNLHSLKLYRLPNLKSIYGNCKNIGMVSRSLPSLETIEIKGCTEMEEIFAAEDEAGDEEISLPKLKKIELSDMPELRRISRQTIVCNSLKLVSVDCRNGVKMENCPISLPTSLASTTHNDPLPVFRANGIPRDWWGSLHWNDSDTLSFLKQTGCFRYCFRDCHLSYYCSC